MRMIEGLGEAKKTVVMELKESHMIFSRRGLEVQLPGATVETSQISRGAAKGVQSLSVVSTPRVPLPASGRQL
jgi:hypothetical protein